MRAQSAGSSGQASISPRLTLGAAWRHGAEELRGRAAQSLADQLANQGTTVKPVLYLEFPEAAIGLGIQPHGERRDRPPWCITLYVIAILRVRRSLGL